MDNKRLAGCTFLSPGPKIPLPQAPGQIFRDRPPSLFLHIHDQKVVFCLLKEFMLTRQFIGWTQDFIEGELRATPTPTPTYQCG